MITFLPARTMRHNLFDLDGTLIDSASSILKSFAAVLDEFGIASTIPLDSSLIGPPLLPTLQRISGVQNAAHLTAMANAFKAHYDEAGYRETVAYPGVSDVLTQLHRRGDRLYIVTNKRIAPTRKILAYLGWAEWFAGIYAQDAFVPAMPSKASVISEAMRRHEIDATRAAYVGDRQEDGEAAVANHLRFIWVKWGYGIDVDPSLYQDGDDIVSPGQLLTHLQ